MLNKNTLFYLLIAVAALLLFATIFGIVNELRMDGPYAAEVSDRIDDQVQINYGSRHVYLSIPRLPQLVDKGTKAHIYTTSLIGRGRTPRKIEFFDNGSRIIYTTDLPTSTYYISTGLICIILTIFAVMIRFLPGEMLFKDHASEEDDKKACLAKAESQDRRFSLMVSLFALFFFISGFCGLLYQTVWLRLAYSHFGVITPVVSVVVSTFMFGLGFGSWLSGRFVSRVTEGKLHAVTLYGIVEAIIGCGALVVPAVFELGSRLLLNAGQTDSAWFLFGSGLCVAAALLPFSIAMGATYPVALRAYEQLGLHDHHRFGFLYAFNTAGAVAGCLITVFMLIELLGFRNTLYIGALLNGAIAFSAVAIGAVNARQIMSSSREVNGHKTGSSSSEPGLSVAADDSQARMEPAKTETAPAADTRYDLLILFITGFCSMAAEVVWIRAYGPVLEQAVYAFGFLLICYLIGHALGAWIHHMTFNRYRLVIKSALLIAAALSSCLSVIMANVGWMYPVISSLKDMRPYFAIAIGTFAAVLGWLTPLLVDRYSRSNPHAAGSAYAVNITGCVLGPLISGYLLVPLLGAQHSLIVLCLPLIALMFIERRMIRFKICAVCLSALILIPALYCPSWEEQTNLNPINGKRRIFRDYAATTVLNNAENGWKELVVNGQMMTTLSPVTKMMADLPIILHEGPVSDVLVICLGMGTTYRTALTWGANVTVVELVPGVVNAFTADKKEFTASQGRIVVDDGRRFLRRTREKYDLIIIDPPPPAEQPTSSLLSSTEFYSLLKEHLKPGGIVQAWYGHLDTEPAIVRAFARSVKDSFRNIKVYKSMDDPFRCMSGLHFICSDDPIRDVTAQEFIGQLPEAAKQDLRDMFFYGVSDDYVKAMVTQLLSRQESIEKLLCDDPSEKITDDRPFNEYYIIRRIRAQVTKS